jgi:hypothetical protein
MDKDFFFFFWDRVSLCNPGWPEILDPPALVSWLLGLQVCITMSGSCKTFWWRKLQTDWPYIIGDQKLTICTWPLAWRPQAFVVSVIWNWMLVLPHNIISAYQFLFHVILKISGKCWWPVLLATWETESGRTVAWGQPGQIVHETPHLQNNQNKMDWRYGSSSRKPALQVQSPFPPKINK